MAPCLPTSCLLALSWTQTLREKAKDVLEPGSAFMFFEQQLEELTEDFGLGGKKMKFWECNQLPGEIIYIPAATIMTSLNIHDALSYKQSIAPSAEAVVARVNSNIWAPESGVIPGGYQFAACFDNLDLAAAGSMLQSSVNPMQARLVLLRPGGSGRGVLLLSVAGVLSLPVNTTGPNYSTNHGAILPWRQGSQHAHAQHPV